MCSHICPVESWHKTGCQCILLLLASCVLSSPIINRQINQHGSRLISLPYLMPCHAQVVMSRGGYTDSIDMWSLGCIFGELLQRVAKIGSASTPRLQVAPLFAITGRPRTPCEG